MKLLLATFFFAVYLQCIAGECLYEYSTHPNVKFTCDPEGSRLSLQCTLKGPLVPSFQLQWYTASKNSDNLEQIKDSGDGYNINTSILDSEGDMTMNMRSITSTLVTPPISSSLTNQCILCGAEFPGMQSILFSSDARLCFGSTPLMPQCVVEGEVYSNTTTICATQQPPQVLLQQEINTDPDFSGSPPITVDATDATTESMETRDITTPPQVLLGDTTPTPSPTLPFSTDPTTPILTQSSTDPTSPAPAPTDPTERNATIQGASDKLPLPTAPEDATDVTTARDETSSAPQGSTEGGLFVAIAICVVFIVIIIILVSIVICLFRQWRWRKEKERLNQDENDGADPNSARPSPGPPVIARGYSVDRFQLDPDDALYLRALEDPRLLTTRSMQDLTGRQLAPPIPPKPQRMLKASSASALNYRGLGLVHGYNNFTFPKEMPQPDQDPSIPPPIPVRSKSRDHFYHTLEYSNTDSGLALSSPQHSRQSSSLDSIREQREDEELEGASPPKAHVQPQAAHQVQLEVHPDPQATVQQKPQPEAQLETESLFDDPRYVAVQVDYEDSDDEDEGMGQGDLRRGAWNSTPSLTSTRQPISSNGTAIVGSAGVGDSRRSLRLTHVVGTQIYN